MAGQKFQYDESGGTFFYFLLSFLALILVPTTLYYWPSRKKEGESPKRFVIASERLLNSMSLTSTFAQTPTVFSTSANASAASANAS